MTIKEMFNKVLEKLKSVFSSFKTYAIIIGLALAALIAFLFFNNKKAFEFISLLQERLNAKEKELEELKKIEEEQKRKQQEIEAKFQATLEELKEKHKIEIEKIDSAKRQELRRLIEQFQENPEEQSRHLAELFGLSTGA